MLELFSSLRTRAASLTLLLLFFVTPLFLFNLGGDVFDGPKKLLIIMVGLVSCVLFASELILKKEFSFRASIFNAGMLLLGISTTLSLLFASAHKLFVFSGSALFIFSLVLLFFSLTSAIRERMRESALFVFLLSCALLSILTLLELFGLFPFQYLFPQATKAIGLFPNGGAFVNLEILTVGFVIALSSFLIAGDKIKRIASGVFLPLLAVAIAINLFQVLPGKTQFPVLVPFLESWSIALDILKIPRTGLVGVGAGMYQDAYTQLKPLSINARPDLWNLRFGAGRNLPLDLLVTHGAIGFVAFVLLTLGLFWTVRKKERENLPLFAGTLVTFLITLLFPANAVILTLLFCFFILIANTYASAEKTILVRVSESATKTEQRLQQFFVYAMAGTLLIVALFGIFFQGRALYARLLFSKALTKVGGQDTKDGYDQMRRAIEIDPYQDDMHRTFGQVSYGIAQSLAGKKDVTDEDRTMIVALMQQAIDQTKQAAIVLHPGDSTNWSALAGIYAGLIGSSQDADQWAVAAYTQAINRDPSNPALRLELSGLYRRGKNIDQASKLLEQAIALKADYANAYFNLADIAKELSQEPQELALLQKTISLISADDKQAQEIQKRIDVLTPRVAEQQAKAAQQASSPANGGAGATPRPTPRPTPLASPTVNLAPDSGIATGSALPEVPNQ